MNRYERSLFFERLQLTYLWTNGPRMRASRQRLYLKLGKYQNRSWDGS